MEVSRVSMEHSTLDDYRAAFANAGFQADAVSLGTYSTSLETSARIRAEQIKDAWSVVTPDDCDCSIASFGFASGSVPWCARHLLSLCQLLLSHGHFHPQEAHPLEVLDTRVGVLKVRPSTALLAIVFAFAQQERFEIEGDFTFCWPHGRIDAVCPPDAVLFNEEINAPPAEVGFRKQKRCLVLCEAITKVTKVLGASAS
eukprot:5599547-Amphidinium_carterae.2